MAKKTSPQRELHRRADNGQFTTKEYAEKHPKNNRQGASSGETEVACSNRYSKR